MNDRLLLDNMLLLLKSTVEVYVHGSLESSNKEVHNALKSNLDTIIKLQDELYKKYGLTADHIVKAAKQAISMKTMNMKGQV